MEARVLDSLAKDNELATRLEAIEAMLRDLDDRLLWLEAKHGVSMSLADRLFAEEMAIRRRRLRSCGLDTLVDGLAEGRP
jgi:hypothetical protein